MLSIRNIIAVKVMANMKMMVVLSIGFFSFATDAVLRNWPTLSFSIGNRWWQSNHVINDDRAVWGEGEYEVGVGRIIGVVKRVLPDLTRHDRTLDLSVHNIFLIHHIDDNYARWTHVLVVLQIDIGLITSFLWRHQECTSPGNRPVMDH